MFKGKKIDDYVPWFYFMECGISKTKKCIEFNIDLFPYEGNKDRIANFHLRWSLSFDFNMKQIFNSITWQ